jgi:CDP-glucose 4,6-dehydratase
LDKLNKLRKFWKNKKVFVTGHTGFKGSWLIIMLNLMGAKAYGYSLKPKKNSLFKEIGGNKLLAKNFYGNINNKNLLRSKIFSIKPEIIFHLAAQPLVINSYKNPLNTFKTNIIGTANLLESVKNIDCIKSVVIITTDKVYKNKKKETFFSEEDELGGVDPYSASKACAELIISSYISSFFKNTKLKNKISSVRSGNVIGGGDYSANRLVPDIIKSINKNKKLNIRNPKHIRPWLHVIEPLFGYILVAEKQISLKMVNSPRWNFGPDKNNIISVSKLVEMFKKIKNLKVNYLKHDKKIFETTSLKLNNKKSKKILGWKPKWSIQKSIEKVIEWNDLKKQKIHPKKICEHQIKKYLKEQI